VIQGEKVGKTWTMDPHLREDGSENLGWQGKVWR